MLLVLEEVKMCFFFSILNAEKVLRSHFFYSGVQGSRRSEPKGVVTERLENLWVDLVVILAAERGRHTHTHTHTPTHTPSLSVRAHTCRQTVQRKGL